MLPRWLIAALVLSPLAGTSCAAVLDIEEADFDQTIDQGGSGGAGPKSLCDKYCDTLAANCVEGEGFNHKQYVDRESCMAVCARIPPGEEGDPAGFTVGCRLRFAQLAGTSEPQLHCSAAGLGSDGACGGNCLGFCAVMMSACPAAYDSAAECGTDCAPLPDLGTFNVSDDMQGGGHVQCRLYHVSVAAVEPSLHCGHAKGAAPCVPPRP